MMFSDSPGDFSPWVAVAAMVGPGISGQVCSALITDLNWVQAW